MLIKNWTIKHAPLHSNIVWHNFFAGNFITSLKAFLMNLLVITLAITFVTPVYFMEFLKKSGVSDTVHALSKIHDNYLSN